MSRLTDALDSHEMYENEELQVRAPDGTWVAVSTLLMEHNDEIDAMYGNFIARIVEALGDPE